MKKMTHDELVKQILYLQLDESKEWYENNLSEKDKKLTKMIVDEVNALGYYIEDYATLDIVDIKDKNLLPILKKCIFKFDNLGISAEVLKLVDIKGFKEAAKLNIEFYEFLKDKEKNGPLINGVDNHLWRIKDKSQMETYKKWFDNVEDYINLPLTMDMYVRWNKKDPEIREKLIEYLNSLNAIIQIRALHELPMFGDKTMVEYVKPLLENASQGEAQFYNKVIDKLNKLK